MILSEFSKYLKNFKDEIVSGDKSAVFVLTEWIRNALHTEPVKHWQRIIHTEITLAENSFNEFLILGKSDSGRVLINALYNYALSYEHYLISKHIPDSVEFRK